MSGHIDADVLVVGAGPAGSAAATTLARAGLEVVVADKARFPREKCCGDGLTTGALRRLDALGLDPRDVASFTAVDSLAVRSPHGRVAQLPLARAGACNAAVARRRDLDAALLGLARTAGATVLEGDSLDRLDVDRTGARSCSGAATPCRSLLESGAEVRSRYVVAADGAWSRVRAQLGGNTGPPRPRRLPRDRDSELRDRDSERVLGGGWHAYRAYATGLGAAASGQLWVWFDPELLPGYGWSFPLAGGVANVGICMRRTAGVSGRQLAAAWRGELAGPFLTSLLGAGARLEGPARSWPIPAGIDRAAITARGGRVLYVGDAAHAADPFTGEGISQALESGVRAAESIVALGAAAPASVEARYTAEIRQTLGLEHQLGRALSALMSHPLGARGAVRLVGLNRWTRRNAGRWLYEAVPRTIPITPRRWRRGALDLPPPYPEASGARNTGAIPRSPAPR